MKMGDEILKQGEELEEKADDKPEGMFAKFIPKNRKTMFILIGVVIFAVVIFAVYASVKARSAGTPDDEQVGVNDTEVIGEEGAEPVYVFTYTQDEIERLRSFGYTADEIETSQITEIPVDVLCEQAEQKIKAEQQKIIDELSDTASEVYQELVNKTWLAGATISLTPTEDYMLEGFVENVDYIKLPPRGNQLFLRLTMLDGTYSFMAVPPYRWMELRDSGNIVIRYVRCNYNGTYVITEIEEIIP
jgi:hypothetical protein